MGPTALETLLRGDNPADLLTRGLPAKVLAVNKLWWSGPSWLSSQCLPDLRELPNELPESVEKERKHKQTKACAEIAEKPVIDPCRFERWLNLVQVTAYMYFEVFKLSSQKQVQVAKNCQSRSYMTPSYTGTDRYNGRCTKQSMKGWRKTFFCQTPVLS